MSPLGEFVITVCAVMATGGIWSIYGMFNDLFNTDDGDE